MDDGRPRDVLAETEAWLAQRGLGTYGYRTTGRALGIRRTRPIRRHYFEGMLRTGKCPRCNSDLRFARNPQGGSYSICAIGGHGCYYIGMNPTTGVGYELLPTDASEGKDRIP